LLLNFVDKNNHKQALILFWWFFKSLIIQMRLTLVEVCQSGTRF